MESMRSGSRTERLVRILRSTKRPENFSQVAFKAPNMISAVLLACPHLQPSWFTALRTRFLVKISFTQDYQSNKGINDLKEITSRLSQTSRSVTLLKSHPGTIRCCTGKSVRLKGERRPETTIGSRKRSPTRSLEITSGAEIRMGFRWWSAGVGTEGRLRTFPSNA